MYISKINFHSIQYITPHELLEEYIYSIKEWEWYKIRMNWMLRPHMAQYIFNHKQRIYTAYTHELMQIFYFIETLTMLCSLHLRSVIQHGTLLWIYIVEPYEILRGILDRTNTIRFAPHYKYIWHIKQCDGSAKTTEYTVKYQWSQKVHADLPCRKFAYLHRWWPWLLYPEIHMHKSIVIQ